MARPGCLSKALAASGKTLHLFDTFAGMPAVREDTDIHRAGDFNDTSLERVRAYLSDCRNVELYQGIFPHTAGPVAQRQFALAHIDVDIYQSVADCCAFFYPRMARGGIMVFDDYGFISCPGVKPAVDAFGRQARDADLPADRPVPGRAALICCPR